MLFMPYFIKNDSCMIVFLYKAKNTILSGCHVWLFVCDTMQVPELSSFKKKNIFAMFSKS
jgi:hypothetical protein